jgi:hypothetical protein
MVALSASTWLGDRETLRAIADEVGAACRGQGVELLLGGQGAWPEPPAHGVRVSSFVTFRDHLLASGRTRP